MESDEFKEPESETNNVFTEQNARDDYATSPHCDITPNSTIENVDVKTEPPDTMDAAEIVPENAQNCVLEKEVVIGSLTIDTIESNINYESENLKDLTLGTEGNVTENQDRKDVIDSTEKLDDSLLAIKQEVDTTDCFAPEVSISYDVPETEKPEEKNGEDLRRSLQEEIVLKVEVEENFEGDCPNYENSEVSDIKTELPAIHSIATENQTTIESRIDRTAGHGDGEDVKRIRLSSQSAPDQMTQLHVYDSDFQLNSITGDMLSLEQEAYGLLEAKNATKVVTQPFVCNKCPKTCRNRNTLLQHMKVHESIERRAQGVQQGKITRELNLKKKELDLTKIGTSKDLSLIPYHYKKTIGESRKGQFKCANCGKQYRVLRCLRRHQRECSKSQSELETKSLTAVRRSRKPVSETLTAVKKSRKPESEPLSAVKKSRKTDNEPLSAVKRSRKPESETLSAVKKKRKPGNEPLSAVEKSRKPENEPLLALNKKRKLESEPLSAVKKFQKQEMRGLRKPKGEKNDIKSESGEYKCECGKTFSRRSRLETCLRSHHPEIQSRRYTCTICTKPFREKSELILHRKRQHVKKKFLCKFCPMDYHTQKELFDHLRVHKKVQMMEYKVISAVVEGNQELKCFICNKTSADLSKLKAHVLVDHKEPYTCPLCKENFPKIVDFATHTKSAHPEVEGQSVLDVLEAFSILAEAWKCEECHVQFEDPDDLVKHQTEQHGPVNKKHHESIDDSSKFHFRCEDCRRTFSTLKQLTTHRDVHHTLKDPNLTEKEEESIPERIPTPPPPRPMCVHCRKICNDEAALTSHLRLHSMERKYPCKFCDFRFATLEKRKSHLGIHTGDMKFVCFICEYRCTSENRLNNHKLTPKHLDLKQALLDGPPLEPQAPVVQPEVKKKRYSSERKKSKSSDVPATCDICGEEFPSEDTMMKHKDTHPFIVFPNEEQPTRIFFK